MPEDRHPQEARITQVGADSADGTTFSQRVANNPFTDDGFTTGLFDWFTDAYVFKTYIDRSRILPAFLGVVDSVTNPYTCYYMPFNCIDEPEQDLIKFYQKPADKVTFDASSCEAVVDEPRLVLPAVVY